jgi:hypothetical protein
MRHLSDDRLSRLALMRATIGTSIILACVHLPCDQALQPAHLMPLLGATGCKIYRTEQNSGCTESLFIPSTQAGPLEPKVGSQLPLGPCGICGT